MKKIKSVLVVFALFFAFANANAQVEKYQSLFIYNFSKYIKWPDDMSSGDFVIGVLGDSEVYTHLKSMADTKKQTQNMNLVVKRYDKPEDVEKCHILYVSNSFLNQLPALSDAVTTKSTLIISNHPGMAQKGATINFIEESGKIKFELNQVNAEQRGLKVSGSLTALSVLV